MRIGKVLTDINILSTICKSDIADKIKWKIFQGVAVSALMYDCTTWTLTKCLVKKLDGSSSRILRAFLNKTSNQLPRRQ